MKAGPNIAAIAALVGDPARANMLTALMAGHALTATELAHEAGITLQTASWHLAKLHDGGLLALRSQGRHRYFSLADNDVAQVLEGLMGLAARTGHLRARPGPKEPALRNARVCYDHLAGDQGVRLYEALLSNKLLSVQGETATLTSHGKTFVTDFGVNLAPLESARRPLCRLCLDWSERRMHLAGALGAAFLHRFYELKWAKREDSTRVATFSKRGSEAFNALLA